jgi:hypothetical protein
MQERRFPRVFDVWMRVWEWKMMSSDKDEVEVSHWRL